MTLTRWKVMAGALGLSLGGLAALADPPPASKPSEPVVPAVPGVYGGPALPGFGAADGVPALPTLPCPGNCPAGETAAVAKTEAAKPALELAPPPRAVTEQVMQLTVPAAAVAPPSPAPTVVPVAAAEVPALPAAPPVQTAPAPAAPAVAAVPVAVAAAPVSLVPAPTPAAAPVPPVQAHVEPSPVPPPPAPTTPPAAVAQAPAPQAAPTPTSADKKLVVLLSMGEHRPRFEVKDAEETLLKLVSDKVDVKSPADHGETLPTMKAVGAVSFYTPGGEGVCDELTLTPGTGQVVVTGKVRFRYHWGKVETEVSGDRMTFRLGAAPGVVTTPGSGTTAIPASFHSAR